MEKKYNPEHIIMGAWSTCRIIPAYSKSKPHNLNIFIEIRGEIDKWFHINITKEGDPVNLWRGHFVGADKTISGLIFHGREQKDSEILFKKKGSLGKVYIKYKMSKIIKEYLSYEEFWKDTGV